MQVIKVIHKFPRKPTQVSVWVVENAGNLDSIESNDYITRESVKQIFCAHPITHPDHAEIIQAAWKVYVATPEGLAAMLKAKEEGY